MLCLDTIPRSATQTIRPMLYRTLSFSMTWIKLFKKNYLFNHDLISYCFRIATVTIYFYTGFHKLNTDFFNPCVSCVNGINEFTISNLFNVDFIVKPILWSNIISPLIDYCRSLSYLKIKPKLFLRRDLYNKLTNLTNKSLP